jgi:S-(hydroxymethyl)glutathione dehydrogenase / alcohol dehydrogenase
MSATAGKVIKCKAAVAWAPKQPLSIEDIEVAPPQAHEVRVRIVATGVCHTDAYVLSGMDETKQFPTILGHESAGIVESVGEGVTKFKAGDHVIPLFVPNCTKCRYCKNPDTNLCEEFWNHTSTGTMADGTSRFTCKGQTVYHFFGTSTFSEYTVVADFALCKIDKAAPMDKVCLLGCGVPTGFGAAVNTAGVKPGSTAAIWGLGGVGLSVAMGCKYAGATRIIGVDPISAKFEVAKQFGCTEFVNPKELTKPIQEVLAEMTDGGVDYSFECCGFVETMRQAFESVHKGWGVATVVGLADTRAVVSAKPFDMLMGELGGS